MRKTKVLGYSKNIDIEYSIELPAIRIVCPRCDGNGKHVNPNVDGNGITAEEFAEDPEFQENYFAGVYDVRCELCNGEKVVDIIDEEACTKKGAPISFQKGWKRHLRYSEQKLASQEERAAEARLGC